MLLDEAMTRTVVVREALRSAVRAPQPSQRRDHFLFYLSQLRASLKRSRKFQAAFLVDRLLREFEGCDNICRKALDYGVDVREMRDDT